MSYEAIVAKEKQELETFKSGLGDPRAIAKERSTTPWDKIPLTATALAEQFPTLRDAPGVSPWDANVLLEWYKGPVPSHGARLAAEFVLSVYNEQIIKEECGTHFDVFEALATWDYHHRAVFQNWALDPYWL